MKTKFLILYFLSLFFIISNGKTQQCTIKEETWQIKTYPFSDPNPVPILVKNPTIYPYFKYEKFSTTGEKQSWKVVILENDYIKVLVLPEVGGKIYGAIEKSTNQEFLYYNKVLKFRQIAMRGPWTSGGTEFNFGIVGHTPTVASPVDYLINQNSDGSVSCFIGAMDLTSRTRWTIEIRLPNDKAFFEIRTSWYNPTPLNQSYYSWSNHAVKASEDLEYVYPGQFRRTHGYSAPMASWPVDKKGRNLSFYKHNNFGSHKAHFVLGEYENFFGGYWHDLNFGFGHWSLYEDMPGKKMWIWALSRQGAIWENLLSDSDGQYSEPQSGRFFSQDDHEFFPPYTRDNWKEILFPFKETGGMVKASSYGVLHITQTTDYLNIIICPLQFFSDDLKVVWESENIFSETISFKPMEVINRSVPIPSEPGNFQVNISNKIKYNSNPIENDINRPFSYHVINESTTEGIYLAGERLEKNRQYEKALKKYLSCLNRDPYHIRAMVRVAEIYYRRAEYQRGFTYAYSALNLDMYDPNANYVYGIISRNLGNFVDAKETLGWASRSMKYRSNAYCQLAEIYMLEKNYELAHDYLQKSINFNKYNIKAHENLSILKRYLNKNEAYKAQNELLQLDPLNHLARFEKYLFQPNQQNLSKFQSFIRNELPHETYLETALIYIHLGLIDDAIKLLENADKNPMIQYWLAYLYSTKNEEKGKLYLTTANQLSPNLVFPFRNESIPVFKWAIKNNPEQWKPYYYLGLIYWSKGRTDEAKQLFEKCNDTKFAPFYAVQAHLNKNLALAYYLQALNTNKQDWRNWHFVTKHYNDNLIFQKALEVSQKATNRFPDEIVISMDYASSLYNNQQYDKCLSILSNLEVLPYEGGWEGHDLYKRVNIHRALEMFKKNNYTKAIEYLEESKKYPEHLGTGKPYNPDYRLQDYVAAICYKKLNETNNEKITQKRIYDFTMNNWESRNRRNLFGYFILQIFREQEKLAQLEQEWHAQENNLTYQWFIAKLNKDQAKAREIEKIQANNPRFKIIADVITFFENEGNFK